MNSLTAIGHIIIGVAAMAGVTVLASLHDVTGSSAISIIIAIAGVSLGVGAATNAANPTTPAGTTTTVTKVGP